MKHYTDITPALRSILLHYTRGYTVWGSFQIEPEKVPRIEEKWIETLGVNLPAWKRQDRKQKKLANAVALSAPVLGSNKTQVILLATEHALTMPITSPWAREKWLTRLPEFSDFVMVREARERGDMAWTWRLQNRVHSGLEQYLAHLVRTGDAQLISAETRHWARLYPMFGGIRRQLRRTINGGRKLWNSTMKSEWPGLDPTDLPMMVGFK